LNIDCERERKKREGREHMRSNEQPRARRQSEKVKGEREGKENKTLQLMTERKLMNSARAEIFSDCTADLPITTNCCSNKMKATKEDR
jgi:hypothetical protein